jgi:hypothetical protein
MRHPRQRVQPTALLSEHHDRRTARDAMLAGVDALAEPLALRLQLGEVLIRRPEVVIGRHQIRLRDPHGRF